MLEENIPSPPILDAGSGMIMFSSEITKFDLWRKERCWDESGGTWTNSLGLGHETDNPHTPVPSTPDRLHLKHQEMRQLHADTLVLESISIMTV